MHILYYISTHGYGHAVRTCAICNKFSPDVSVTIRTAIPRQFFDDELFHPYSYFPDRFDCGCLQKDSLTVEIRKTLQTYQNIAEKNRRKLAEEVDWCKTRNVDVIVSDIPPFAFEVASVAGIPSIGVTNFSWYDIYEPYIKQHPEFGPCLETIYNQYHSADLLIALHPPSPMVCFKNRENGPIVGKRGENKRSEILKWYKINPDKKIALLYTGTFGMGNMTWRTLENFTEWVFIGTGPLDGNPANYFQVNKKMFPYKDYSASVDLIISKIGYGVYSECMVNGIPLLYTPRTDFAEHTVLEQSIKDRGHVYSLPQEKFQSLDWDQTLKEVLKNGRAPEIVSHGAQFVADRIESFL